jgi:hypothetical protein
MRVRISGSAPWYQKKNRERRRRENALEPKLGADGRGGYSVLTGSRFGEDALLANPLGEKDLSDGVVDLSSEKQKREGRQLKVTYRKKNEHQMSSPCANPCGSNPPS